MTDWEPWLAFSSHTYARNFVNLGLLWNFLRKFLRRHGTDYTKAEFITRLLFRTPMPSLVSVGASRLTSTSLGFVPYLQKNNYIKLVFLLDCYACLIQNY